MRELRACVLADLPPPADSGAPWTVSGHALVEAYQRCAKAPAAAGDFRALCHELARPVAEDPSLVVITASPGGAP